MGPAPNKGACWLLFLRWSWETYIGMEVTQAGSNFIVTDIREFGPAWCAGASIGDRIRAYSQSVSFKPYTRWKASALAEVNSFAADSAFGIQFWKTMKVQGLQHCRSEYLLRKKSGNRGKQQFNLSDAIDKWDRKNFNYAELHANQGRLAAPSGVSSVPIMSSAMPASDSVSSPIPVSSGVPVAPSGVPVSSPIPVSSGVPASSPMLMSDFAEHDIEFDDYEMNSPQEELEDAAVIWFQQIGGRRTKLTIQHGWLDTITGEDMYNPSKNLQRHWLTSDMVSFFGHRYAQPIPFQRLRILESQAYSTIVERKNVKAWERATRGVAVVCLSVCNNSHWTLIIVLLTSTTPRVFHLDSLNVKGKVRPVAKAVGKLLSVSAKPISVPIQQNGNDCGVHVVSHMMTLMRLMNKVNDNDLATYMEPLQFSTVLTRDDLKCDLVNAVEEAMCEHSYWAQCQLDNGEWMWWPCRRFSHGFGARLGVQLQEDGVLVAWYGREVNGMMCIPRSRICPLKYLTVEDACLLCTYEDDEKVMLQEAYRQASL